MAGRDLGLGLGAKCLQGLKFRLVKGRGRGGVSGFRISDFL